MAIESILPLCRRTNLPFARFNTKKILKSFTLSLNVWLKNSQVKAQPKESEGDPFPIQK